ncbi:hypothetical protein AGMMS49928_28460 [Spirochaetia bacterium]|nr:hypothetical protein AGMMS49928_28460 [Spirochaetia bacterium]
MGRRKKAEIDNSGIPRAERKLSKPLKIVITCRVDVDIVDWLKKDGKGYQSRLNSILRQAMTESL